MTATAQALRDKTAIVGVGLKMGKYQDNTALELAVQCYQEALDDAGRYAGRAAFPRFAGM